MRRREFTTLVGGALAWPLAARAQQQPNIPVIGFASGGSEKFLALAARARTIQPIPWRRCRRTTFLC
jgi:hypothetical protein